MPTVIPDQKQQTLERAASVEGVGLFTGKPARMTLHPAGAGAGIVFTRVDLEGEPEVPATVEHVVQRPRRTMLERNGASVETVEHCLSALAGMGIDNARIEIDGPEVPAGDGSAGLFVEAIESAGVREQDGHRNVFEVTEPITVREGDAVIAALPNGGDAGAEYVYVLDYGDASPIGRQAHTFALESGDYARSIAPARTFSTEEDARAARAAGMFAHLTTKDMLVIGEGGPIDNTFRFADEPVRHKMLDLIGDLALSGVSVRGRIVATKSGHALNHQMARALKEAARRAAAGQPVVPEPAMDIKSILRLLPHRYPMILVDRVLEIDGDERAVGVKNVTINEPFFQGHYPGAPIMPGVLIVEAMCQLSGLMLSHKLERTGKVAMLMSLDRVKLRKPVTPGDQLVIETRSIRTSTRFGDVEAEAFVAGDLAAEARIKFMMVDAEHAG